MLTYRNNRGWSVQMANRMARGGESLDGLGMLERIRDEANCSFAQECQHDDPISGPDITFKQDNLLPGPHRQSATTDRDRE
jgi:hypothetical protein